MSPPPYVRSPCRCSDFPGALVRLQNRSHDDLAPFEFAGSHSLSLSPTPRYPNPFCLQNRSLPLVNFKHGRQHPVVKEGKGTKYACYVLSCAKRNS